MEQQKVATTASTTEANITMITARFAETPTPPFGLVDVPVDVVAVDAVGALSAAAATPRRVYIVGKSGARTDDLAIIL